MSDLISEQAKKVEKDLYQRLQFVIHVYGYDNYSLANYLRSVILERRITVRTIGSWQYCHGLFSALDINLIREICKKFHVSSDYLLGLSDDFAVHVDVKKKAV